MATASQDVLPRHVGLLRGSLNCRNQSGSSSTPPPPKRGKITASTFARKRKTERKALTIPRKQVITTELADRYACLLRECGEARALSQGKLLHQDIRQAGLETDRYVGNLLLQMYGKCSAVQDAYLVFTHMPQKNVFTWNLMMGAYIDNGFYKEAVKVFQCMLRGPVTPDAVTLVSALTACSTLLSLAGGKWVHAYISRHDFKSNPLVGTALVNLYAKCGSLDEAWTTFDALITRDAVSWNTMIVTCAQNKLGRAALQLLHGMLMEGLMPTKVTLASVFDACANFAALRDGKRIHAIVIHSAMGADVALDTALLNMYARCGQLEDAERVFNEMPQQNLVSWSAMIAAYAQHGHSIKVLQVSRKMQCAGLIPNEVTLVSILTACSHAGLVEEARYWFTSMVKDYSIVPIAEHYNCMIDLLGRMGRLDQGEELLCSMPSDAVSSLPWLTLLGACKNHTDVERAKHAAEKVMQLDPDNVAPYIQLSNIYCEAGMWEDAERIRKMMDDRNLKR